MKTFVICTILAMTLSGCATGNATINLSFWRSAATLGGTNDISQVSEGGGVDAQIPAQ